MNNKVKKIDFIPWDNLTDNVLEIPEPATKNIPEWYKKMPLFLGNDKKHGIAPSGKGAANTTMKSCSPFMDAITAGYIVKLPVDLEIRNTLGLDNLGNPINTLSFRWKTAENELVSAHHKDQHPTLPNIIEGQDLIMKFSFTFKVKTPKGYSCLFTHPLNRHDLPFRTFSGVVDTDEYPICVQFPFQITEKIEDFIIIEKDTPIVQIFPFKRENWISSKGKLNLDENQKSAFNFNSKIKLAYKSRFWSKKRYE
jgi:hypothetical protein